VTIDPQQASAMLADVDSIVARVKQSRIYRRSGDIFIMWGGLHLLRHILFPLSPIFARGGWVLLDVVGIAATLLMLRGARGFGQRSAWRWFALYLLFYGFGYMWSDVIGGMRERQLIAFWPTLFQFGYAVAGLWFGWAFLAIGLGAASATVGAYLYWPSESYSLAISIINASALIAAGLWMRRA
jgi:hypothetical protein